MPRQIHVHELAAKLAAKEPIYLIDVREPWEHDLAALNDDVLIPLDQLPDRIGEVEPREGATIVTVCHHGIRSLSAAALLEQAGFANVVSLAGGIDAWSVLVDPRVPRY